MKPIIIILLRIILSHNPILLLAPEWPHWPLNSKGLAFYNFFFCIYGYLLELIFPLLTFGDKRVRVLAGPFQRSKILCYVLNIHLVQNFTFPNGKHILPHSLNSWNLRKWNISFMVLRSPDLCKFQILFLAVKLKLGHNFSQFICRFKTGTSESWTKAVLSHLSQFTKKFRKLWLLNVVLAGLFNFSQFMEETENIFQYQLRLYLQIFPSSLNS